MDKELLVLTAVEQTPETSQRELAQQTGLSLGTVNILLKKMIREGLLKLEKIPSNRVAYMLTPKGIAEKKKKTIYFIKHYYRFIADAQDQIRKEIGSRGRVEWIYLNITDPTIRDIVLQIAQELQIKLCSTPDKTGDVLIITDDKPSAGREPNVLYIEDVIL